jgi:Domain of unknown function (DUF4389)
MSDTPFNTPVSTPGQRSIWVRGLIMVLMAMAFQLVATLLCFVALVQFVLALVNSAPNPRLSDFGRGLGRYLHQIADFESFGTEDAPFPFSDWPSAS